MAFQSSSLNSSKRLRSQSQTDLAFRRWTIAGWLAAITIVGLGVVPSVLVASKTREERLSLSAMTGQLTSFKQRAERMKKRQVEINADLSDYGSRGFVAGQEEELRAKWLSAIRKSNAKIRRIDLSPPGKRPWRGESDKLTVESMYDYDEFETGLSLHWVNVQMIAEGSPRSMEKIVDQLFDPMPMAQIEQISLRPLSNTDAKTLQLRIELRLFGIAKAEPEYDEFDDPDFASMPELNAPTISDVPTTEVTRR